MTELHTTKPLRLIQVGAGGMGRAWLRTISDNDQVELVGLVDLDVELARTAATEAGFDGVPVGRSITGLGALPGGTGADWPRADAVVNVTVPQAHLPVNAEALRLGLPVLCEKPLSESLSECLRMAALSEVTGRLLMVSQSRRYWRAVVTLQRQLAGLGRIELASCEFARGPRFGGFRETMAHPLLIDMAIHQFDLARMLLQADPVSVVAQTWNPSWSWFDGDACASAIFTFDSGARFSYVGSWCSPGLETSWNGEWRLAGPDGSAVWDGDHAPMMQTAGGEVISGGLGDEPEQIAGSLVEFIDAVRTGVTPSGAVHTNIVSVAMVLAAVRSAETGLPVALADLVAEARAEALDTELDPAVRAAL